MVYARISPLLGSPVARRGLPLLLLGLLFACTPGASPLSPSPLRCTSDRRLCLALEGTPRVGQPFTLTLYLVYSNLPQEPPVTLTLIAPSSLELIALETQRPYQTQSNLPVPLVDPAELSFEGHGTFTATGTLITVDLGHAPAGKIRHPLFGNQETAGETMRLVARVKEAGEWQLRSILRLPVEEHFLDGRTELHTYTSWLDLLGWSTPSQAYWTDYETALMRVELEIKGPQCGGARPCTIRFPYDPYRFALGVPPEAPGRPLWKRPTTFCGSYERPGTCTDYGLPEVSPEDFQPPEERPTPVSPSASSPPPPAAPARWLELSGRIHYRDPLTHAPLPARRVRVELWNEPEPSPSPCSGLPRPTPRPPRVPPPTPPLACRRARLDVTYTGEDGSYSFSVPTAFPLRIVLRVYAQDDQRVNVRPPNPTQAPDFHKTEPIELNPGTHVLNVTIQDEDLGAAFFIYDTLTRLGWEGLQREVGWSPRERLNVYWPGPCVFGQIGGSCYFYNGIRLTEPDGRSPDAILHEFGHFVLSRFHGDNPIILACAPTFEHAFPQHTSLHCAWSEGWASFLAAALLGQPRYQGWDLEDPLAHPDFPRIDPVDPHATNADNEWATAAALWDLFDHLPEPWDPHADGWDGPARNGIWTLSTQRGFNLDLGIEEFWLKWVERRPDRLGEAACPMYRLQILLAADPSVSPIPYGLCPPGWSAAFFQDQDDGRWTLNGPITWPTFTALVTQTTWPAIAFNTHSAPNQPVPGLRGTFWSARFSGWLLVPQPASLRFFFDRLDDGGRLLLNNTRVFESWIVHGPRDETVEPFLPAGLIPITVEYAQGPAYEASLFLNWEGPGWAKELLGPIRLLGADIAPTPTPAGWDRISPLGPDRRTPPPRPTGTPSP
jgi:hypothetical protein